MNAKPIGRHGDIGIWKIDDETDTSDYVAQTDAVLAGSHGGAHVVAGSSMVKRVDARTQKIILAAPTTISHADRHVTKPLPVGTLLVEVARTAEGLVED